MHLLLNCYKWQENCHELQHVITNKMTCAPSEESSLSAWRNLWSLAIHIAHSEDSDQTVRMPRPISVFAWVHMSFCWFCRAAAQIIPRTTWYMTDTFRVRACVSNCSFCPRIKSLYQSEKTSCLPISFKQTILMEFSVLNENANFEHRMKMTFCLISLNTQNVCHKQEWKLLLC